MLVLSHTATPLSRKIFSGGFLYQFVKVRSAFMQSCAYDIYDKAIYCYLKTYKPCFPSYERIMDQLGISRGRLLKSLRALELGGVIVRIRKNKQQVEYICRAEDNENAPDDAEVIEYKPVHQVDRTSLPGRPEPVHQVDANKNKNKNNLISVRQTNRLPKETKTPTVSEIIEQALSASHLFSEKQRGSK